MSLFVQVSEGAARLVRAVSGEDILPHHYELMSLLRHQVCRTVLRVPTRRKLLGGRTLFEDITEGTRGQAGDRQKLR